MWDLELVAQNKSNLNTFKFHETCKKFLFLGSANVQNVQYALQIKRLVSMWIATLGGNGLKRNPEL